jgi:signal transduction histidine kinase
MTDVRGLDRLRQKAADTGDRGLVTAARVFTLATALGLTLVTGGLYSAAVPLLMLCVVAAIMSIPVPTPALRLTGPIAEGALIGLMLGSAGEAATPLLAYLLIPPFVAGIRAGRWVVVLTTVAEAGATAASLLTTGQHVDLAASLDRIAPWILIGLGLGLLGAWVRSRGGGATEQERYESAHRLLAQLHAIARDLPQGLDAPSLAQRTLSHAISNLPVTGAMLLVRDASDSFRELAAHGDHRFGAGTSTELLSADCWESGKPGHALVEDADASYHRVIVPVRVGARMTGVLLVDTPRQLGRREVHRVQSRLDEQSLRLDSALLFEQVRSMATVEERHRLAREIHDGIAQEIASLGYLVDDLAATSDSDDARGAAHALRSELSRLVTELRFSIFDLRMDVAQHGGLAQALSDYARDVGARAGLMVHVALAEKGRRLPVDVETELLRIAQEAITNARKHARANNLWVTLNTNGEMALLRIEDDGLGSAGPRADHYGLQMMRERADRIGAELAITNRARGGTSVVVALQQTYNYTPGVEGADLSTAR